VRCRLGARLGAVRAAPGAPDGAPNVVYIVLDDVGYSAMSCYGGPIETPNIDRIAADGVRFTQWHTTALCSRTRSCLLTGRNHTRNSMACITEAASGFPNASGTIKRVAIDVSGQPYLDLERQAEAMLARE
jgi:arylsulfatase A-like enzyme